MQILTEQEVMDRYKLRKNFIRRNRARFGGIGKPTVYSAELIEQVLAEMISERTARRPDVSGLAAIRATISARSAVVPIRGRILGRGGRTA